MKKKLLLILFSFAIFLPFFNVYAVVNTNTQNILTIPEVSALSTTYVDQTHTLLEFYQTLSQIPVSSTKDMIISQYTNNNGITYPVIYIYSKNSTDLYSLVSVSGDIRFRNSNNGTTYYKIEGLNFRNSSDIYQTQFWTDIYSCYYDSNCSSSNFTSTINLNYITIGFNSGSSCSNNSNCNFTIPSNSFSNYETMFIYSTKQLQLDQSYNSSSSSWYYKTNVINGNIYSTGSYFPMYFDLYPPIPPIPPTPPQPDNPSVFQFDDKLHTMFIKIPTSDTSNFKATLNYSLRTMSSSDYIDNLPYSPQVDVWGRVNHGNYYTYDYLYCDFYDIDTTIPTDTSVKVDFTNIVCNSGVNLSNYDYIYFQMYYDYSDFPTDLSKEVIGVSFTSNKGYYTYFNTYGIYEYFEGLNSGFQLFLSSNTASNIPLYSSTDTTWYSAYDTTNFTRYDLDNGNINQETSTINLFTTPTWLSLNRGNYYGYMIYNDSTNNYTSSTNLTMFLGTSDIVSFSSGSNNNDYYYYDTQNNSITNSTIIIHYDNYLNNDYDLSYYFGIATNFIDNMSIYILEFGSIVQSFYDNIPELLQTLILFIFIMFCIMFTYKLIRK